MKKVLFVIDYQNDFVAPNGVLSIPTAPNIANFIQEKINDQYDQIIYTMDTHTPILYQISEESKAFPNIHCEFNTVGWQWFKIKPNNNFQFNNVDSIIIQNKNEIVFLKDKFSVWEGNKYFKNWMNQFDKDTRIDVVGVAFEYCVYYAVEGLKKEGFNNINIFMQGTDFISIEGQETAIKAYKEMNINLIGA